jgi:hypothetical protein
MKKILITLLVFNAAFIASAEVFVLDFEGAVGAYLETAGASGVYTTSQNGVTLEMTFLAGGTGGAETFNKTTSGFGINNSESGDDTDAFDDGEFMTISFNSAGTFQSIEFDRLGSGTDDTGDLSFDGGAVFNFDGDSNNPLAINTIFSTNQIITLEHTGDLSPDSGTNTRGFGLEKITVNVVPEPATIAMLGLGGLIALLINRFSRK